MDLSQIGPVRAAQHGDQRELVALLRSGKPLDQTVRDYIADELEKEPSQRFRQQHKSDLNVYRDDVKLFSLINHAKWELQRPNASDRAALDWLSGIGIDINQDDLGNARKRRKSAKK